MKNELYYALFHAYPASKPPFDLELGFANETVRLADCAHIPDSIERMLAYCAQNKIKMSSGFVLLYPIYLEIMDTDDESTMHQIAWLIKDEADKHHWQFNRVGGYTGLTPQSFIPN